LNFVTRYTRWLHTQWPAGKVEKLPEVREDGATNVAGLYVIGDLTGVPLLKFSADWGPKVVRQIVADSSFQRRQQADDVEDLVIIGAGVSGVSAAIEAEQQGLRYQIYEASEPFFTIVNFPKQKPIFTYPTDMTPRGDLQFHEKSEIKEGLLEDLREQMDAASVEPINARVDHVQRKGSRFELVLAGGDRVKAHRVIVGIGRSGNFRRLNVPGEDLDKVYNRLHDPQDFCGQNVLVVGGGDSAMEAAIALARCGAKVALSYRKPEFSRPKPENVEKLYELVQNPDADVAVEEPSSERVTTAAGAFLDKAPNSGSVELLLPSNVQAIRDDEVDVKLEDDDRTVTLPNDAVFAMIGREPPLDFFRRSGVHITGEWRLASILGLTAFVLFCFWMYHWKSYTPVPFVGELPGWLSPNPGSWLAAAVDHTSEESLVGTIARSATGRSFYYTVAYSLIVVIFGIRRIRRRKTPYITWQTSVLMAIQVIPLFILPEILLPWMGANGWFDQGVGKWIADQFWPGESYWRAYGLILAWPLFVFNWFTSEPLWGWLVLGALQTFVLIPAIIYYWGKGSYCGWICSCGAMAETLGDQFRHKMPHGPGWNRLNMLGQGILFVAVALMILRIAGWAAGPESWPARSFDWLVFTNTNQTGLNYKWLVDLMLAGVLGYGLYFWFSGRMWCRFACPLAALMHIYARFSRFRILADKKKCISCNVCTSVCHQGIDVMNFANKGRPMNDPECVRCSACVQSCPTGVLYFGQVNPRTNETIKEDPRWLAASPVRMAELTVNGKRT
jgi:NosR/NirI family transcriptional regulator, nitrous oxide reductase regulator